MTVKELKDWLGKYPDDARIVARVIARNGRGGTFEEQLFLNDSHHDEQENAVYLNCGFEIGWLNAHPEFQPPAEPEAKTDDEARDEIFADLGTALSREVKPEQKLSGLTLDEIRTVLGACDHLVGNGNKSLDNTASRTPGTPERLLSLGTFGNLVYYMLGYCGCEPATRILASCSCGDAPELRTGPAGKYAYVCPNCGRAGAITDTQEQAAVLWNQAFGGEKQEIEGIKPLERVKSQTAELRKEILDDLVCQLDDPPQITEETTFQELHLDSLDLLSLMAATRVLHEDGKTSYEPLNTATLLSCKTFGGLIDYLIDGKEATY